MYFNIDNTITRFGCRLNKYRFTAVSIICHNCFNSQLSAMSSTLKTLVICGPSGSGKSTLLNRLISQFLDCFKFSVSHTTRSPRSGEVNGREYYFVDRQTFEKMIHEKQFVEFTQFSGNYYGTSIRALEDVQRSGRIPVLDVEIKGVQSLKESGFNAKYVFIKPPNFEALERNLRSRGSEDEQSLQRRLSRALEDIKQAESGLFDLIIINDNLEMAYQQLEQFVKSDISQVQKLLKPQKNKSD